jgi:hypothetical protein
MAAPVPSYAEVQTLRRRNASVLAAKALAESTLQPAILNVYDDSKPAPRRPLIAYFPSVLLSGSSLLHICATLLLVADMINTELKWLQLYTAFGAPLLERAATAAKWVLVCGVALAAVDAAIIWHLLRRKRPLVLPPSALQWLCLPLTGCQGYALFRGQQTCESRTTANALNAAKQAALNRYSASWV